MIQPELQVPVCKKYPKIPCSQALSALPVYDLKDLMLGMPSALPCLPLGCAIAHVRQAPVTVQNKSDNSPKGFGLSPWAILLKKLKGKNASF